MKLNRKSQAGAKDDSGTKDDVTPVRQHNAKPHVVCSQTLIIVCLFISCLKTQVVTKKAEIIYIGDTGSHGIKCTFSSSKSTVHLIDSILKCQ